MLDFRKSLINGTLNKVLQRLNYRSEGMLACCTLVGGVPIEPATFGRNASRTRRFRGLFHSAPLGDKDFPSGSRRFPQTEANRRLPLGSHFDVTM